MTDDKKAKAPKIDMNGYPTRQEIVEIMTQLTDNVNQMGNYLMQDVNTMYSNHVFPFQMRLSVLEDIIIEKGLATQDDIAKRVEEKIEKLKEQAKEIKEPDAETESESEKVDESNDESVEESAEEDK